MAFDAESGAPQAKKRIAVIGSGVAGLSAAWLLSSAHDVIVYERDTRLGGHANTVNVDIDGEETPVDAGFIVYNEPNYPNLTALFDHLGLETEESCMSFAASMRGGALEYSGQTLSSVFANRANAVSPRFLRMLGEIVRFHREARKALKSGGEERSLRDFVARNRYSATFVRDFLQPMASAIWSTPSDDILDFPAFSFFQFFDNHGLLQVLNLPIWHTVSGGSARYVEKLAAPIRHSARLSAPVAAVTRSPAGVRVVDGNGREDVFDAAVIAAHADAALAMLADADAVEQRVLGAFSYQSNTAYLHFDEGQMPKRRRAWASWNYVGEDGAAGVTYWMNRLQNLTCRRDVFVSLNPPRPVRDDLIVAEFSYDHPMFDLAAGAAQKELWSLQGRGGVWFCGAHFGHGFHEDGLQAGLAVAEALGGVRRPWAVPDESGRIHLPAPSVAMAGE